MRTKHHPMPADQSLPESRAEATDARASVTRTIVGEVLDLPGKIEGKSLKWVIIFLGMIIALMFGGALWYQQKQMFEMRAETVAVRLEASVLRSENIALRDRLTDYLVTANQSTVSALNANTLALNESNRIMHRVELALDRVTLPK